MKYAVMTAMGVAIYLFADWRREAWKLNPRDSMFIGFMAGIGYVAAVAWVWGLQ